MSLYLVVTYGDRLEAEAAYERLQAADLALLQLELVGAGHKNLEAVKVFDPNQIAWQQATRMIWWLVPFGFFAGFSFNQITQLTILEDSSSLLNHCLGGLLGAVSGGMGGFTFGGGAQILVDREKMPLRKRLKLGKYLLIAQGTDLLIRQATRSLQGLPSDSVQIYEGLN